MARGGDLRQHPFAFLDRGYRGFTATDFDPACLYAYGQQPRIGHHNLRRLLDPLAMLLPREVLEARLAPVAAHQHAHDERYLPHRLDFARNGDKISGDRKREPPSGGQTLQRLTAWADLQEEPGVPEPFLAGTPPPPRALGANLAGCLVNLVLDRKLGVEV